MSEVEFLERYRSENKMLNAYANHLLGIINDRIHANLKIDPEYFLKIPLSFRLKAEDSIIQKAFYRNKNYSDPYNEITDKIGGRIVVLLEGQANDICKIIESLPDIESSKDRDFELEREINPELFDYKSHHYILRNTQELSLDYLVPIGTPMEIQIRTLLQHAYSELTHDTIYKPNTIATPEVRRAVAKSMALIEVTDNLFSHVNFTLKYSENQFNKIINDTSALLSGKANINVDINLCNLILDAYLSEIEIYDYNSIRRFSNEFEYIFNIINDRSNFKLLFQQPVILYIYFLVQTKRKITKSKWPLSNKDLELVYTDLGYSFDML